MLRVSAWVGGGVVLASMAATPRAQAANRARCAAAYEQTQELRRQHHLTSAREQIAVCLTTCSKNLAQDCRNWEKEIVALTPTVRFIATDAVGHAVVARVLVDGVVVTESANAGTEVAVDAGDHVVHFLGVNGISSDVKVTLAEGERSHPIEVVLAPPAPPPLPPPERAMPPLVSYVLGGVGAASLVAAGALALKGHLDAGSLRSSCAPKCTPSSVDDVSHLYNAGWITGGLGLGALAAALVVWHPWNPNKTPTTALALSVQAGGAWVGWSWTTGQF
jgi:hypothetical protein